MFDTHCHLTDLADPAEALSGALAAGLRAVLCCGYDTASNRAVCALSDRFPGLPVALGLHPWFVEQPLGPVLELIRERCPWAVGEVGLDLRSELPLHVARRQLEVLESQLELAAELDLPVTLHSRGAIGELLAVLRNHPRLRGALHAFGGSYEQARAFVDRGLFIGVGGAVTRGRAKRLRRAARALPLDAIVLETDAPAIGMDGVEPPDVRPAHLVRVARALGELRGIDVAEVEQHTDANAIRLLGPRALVDLRQAGWS